MNISNNYLPEIVLLRYILVYNIYKQYYRYLNTTLLKEKYPEVYVLYKAIADLHNRVPNTDKNLAEFRAWFFANYPMLKPAEVQAHGKLFEQLESIEVQESVASEIFEVVTRRQRATEVAKTAWDVSEGKRPWSDLQLGTSLESTQSGLKGRKLKRINLTLEEIKNGATLKPGLRWPLDSLNLSLGSLRVGDFGFLFARPETGKTTFLSFIGTHFASQAKQRNLGPGIWFNMEEQGEKVWTRIKQAHLGYNLSQLFASPAEHQRRFDQDIGESLVFIDENHLHRADVEQLCEDTKPSFIIFDQLDKVKGFDADRPDLVFGEIYQWARGLAKQFAPVIGVCQASGEGEGVRWLTMDHVAEAKTSKQAEADWILGIGRSHDAGLENTRYINISKNKLFGDEDSLPNLRHGRFEVLIKPEIAQYEDIT